MPSLLPMSARTSVSGSTSTPKRRCIHSAARLAVRLGADVARVLVVLRVADGLGHRVDDAVRRGAVGIADAERDDVDALRLLRLLLAVDLGEQVRRQIGDAVGGPHGDASSLSQARRPELAAHPSRRRPVAAGPLTQRVAGSIATAPPSVLVVERDDAREDLFGGSASCRRGRPRPSGRPGRRRAARRPPSRSHRPASEAATSVAHAPVPHASVSPTPRSQTRSRIVAVRRRPARTRRSSCSGNAGCVSMSGPTVSTGAVVHVVDPDDRVRVAHRDAGDVDRCPRSVAISAR